MDLGRFFQRLSLYRAARGVPMWVLVALSLAFYLVAGISEAQAACTQNATYPHLWTCDTSTEARAAAAGGHEDASPYCTTASRPPQYRLDHEPALKRHIWKAYCNYFSGGWTWKNVQNSWASYTTDNCPAPKVAQDDGTCKDPAAECLAKPPLGSTFAHSGSGSVCKDGCLYTAPKDSIGIDFGDGQGFFYNTSGYKPSGGTCTTDNVNPSPNDNQACKPAPNGQTFCIKPDGQACASASTGRQICWRPGETGEKADGNIGQRQNPGTDSTPPTPPPGETMTPTHPPQTNTTNFNNTIITTTLTTGGTANGTNAAGPGGTNTGEPADGSGSGSGDGTGAGGGGSCDDPPIVTGDAALAMVATQAWSTRCAVEAGNAANVTGDIGNCSQAFTVEGTNANAVKLRALRAQICGDSASAGEVASAVAEAEGILDGTGAGEPGDHEALQGTMDEVAFEREIIGSDIFGTPEGFLPSNAQCPLTPQINVGPLSTRINLDPLCELFINMGSLVLALAYFQGARIYAGGS